MIQISRLEEVGRNCGVYGAVERMFGQSGVMGPWEGAVFKGRPEGNQAKFSTVLVEVDGNLVEAVLLAAEAGGEAAIEFLCDGGVLRGKRTLVLLAARGNTRLFRRQGGHAVLQPKQVVTLAQGDDLNIANGFAVVLLLP